MLPLLRLGRKPGIRIFLSFLLIWNWNDKNVHTLPYFLRKPNPIPDQNGKSVYPFSDQNGAKTLPDGTAHTYMAYTREYPPPPGEICRILSFVLSKYRLKFAKKLFLWPHQRRHELCFLRPTCKVNSFLNFRTTLAHNIFDHYFFMKGI